MKNLIFALALGAMVCAGSGASAQTDGQANFTDSTRCAVLNVFTPNTTAYPEDLQTAFGYIQGTAEALDDGHVENGDPGITTLWDDDMWAKFAALVALDCSKHPKETVYNATAELYNSFRVLSVTLGQGK